MRNDMQQRQTPTWFMVGALPLDHQGALLTLSVVSIFSAIAIQCICLLWLPLYVVNSFHHKMAQDVHRKQCRRTFSLTMDPHSPVCWLRSKQILLLLHFWQINSCFSLWNINPFHFTFLQMFLFSRQPEQEIWNFSSDREQWVAFILCVFHFCKSYVMVVRWCVWNPRLFPSDKEMHTTFNPDHQIRLVFSSDLKKTF